MPGLWRLAQRRSKPSTRIGLTPVAHKTIIDHLQSAAILLDMRGIIVEINQAAVGLCTLSEQEARGKPLAAALPWWKDVEQRYDRCIELQEDIQITIRGKKRRLNLQITPLWDNRQILTGRLILIREINTADTAEESPPQAAVRTEFLAKVSHELRTPLTSILGVSEMLDYGVYGPLSREQKDALRLISDSSQHMARLVNDLLEQTRLDCGALELDVSEFVVEDLIARLRANTIQGARSKGLSLTLVVAPDVPAILRGDAMRIYQILRNLVDNAIKYTDKGRVKLRVFRSGQDQYAFEVSDTGIGIPKDKQSLIFRPFLRVHPNKSPNGNGNGKSNGNGNGNGKSNGNSNGHVEGFGLGLSIVKQLTKLMDGEIELDSDEGLGSTFTVKLHLEPAREPISN